MRKLAVVLFTLAAMSGSAFALDMKGKTGVGLRNDSFEVRHFLSNSWAVNAGGNYSYSKPDNAGVSDSYDLMLGGFWAKEIYTDILLEAGAVFTFAPGRNAGATDKFYGLNPFIGAEIMIKDHFGFDFKVIPVSFQRYDDGSGVTTKSFGSMAGSLGAHIYF